MKNLLVFSDSHQADGFEWGVNAINSILSKYKLKIKTQFIEDFESDEGEFAYYISVVSVDLKEVDLKHQRGVTTDKYIVSSQIFVEWNDSPKQVRLDAEMPDDLTTLFDEWLNKIEYEVNV